MSIASRIEAIEQHLTDDYSVLTLAGADLTNVDKNILNLKQTWEERLLYFINNGTDVIWNNWEKVTGEGTELTLNNTLEAPMKIDLKGNTSQESTTGKNLFELPNSKSSNGIIYTNNGDGTFDISGQTTANFSSSISIDLDKSGITTGTYTFSCKSKGYTAQIDLYEGNRYISTPLYRQYGDDSLTATGTITITSNITKIVCQIYVPTGKTLNLANETIMLESGNQATSWEKYTGGQPSPNPEYPQDIQVVSGDNEIKVIGGDFFSSENLENATITSTGTYTSGNDRLCCDYVSISSNENIASLSFNRIAEFFGIAFYDNNKTYLSREYLNNKQSIVASIPNNAKYCRGFVQISSGTALNSSSIQTYQIKLQKGIAYPINLPEGTELCKIGTYQDYIRKSTGKNLFDKNNANIINGYLNGTTNKFVETENGRTAYIECKPNTTYTISKIQSARFVAATTNTIPSNNTPISNTVQNNTATKLTITTDDSSKYLCVFYYFSTYDTLTEQQIIDSLMIEEGNISIPVYEPYGKVWYLHKEIGKVVLNGSETGWTDASSSSYHRYSWTKTFIKNDSTLGNLVLNYCNNFKSIKFNDRNTYMENTIFTICNNAIAQSAVSINTQDITSLNDFKTWLSTNNTIVYYVLATPTNTEITGELLTQLNALGNANSYNNQTNISQDNNDLASILSVSALEEM